MRILVTGANGYIGHHVVRRLLDCGHQVVAADIATDRIDPRAEIMEVDLLSCPTDLYDKAGRPDACIHFCWRDGFKHNSPLHMTDLSSHYRLLSDLIDQGLPRLAVMGSMHEVGYHEGAVGESTPCRPMSLYAVAKNALRDALTIYTRGRCQLQWLRGYYVMGDDRSNHSIFSKLLEAADAGKTTFPFTSGRNRYDFIDIAELAEQIEAVVTQGEIDGIINVCTGRPVSLGEKVEQFIADNALPLKLDYGAYPDRPYDSPEIYGDTAKIRAIIDARAKSKQ